MYAVTPWTVDRTVPVVTILAPAPSAAVKGAFTVTGTATDTASVVVAVSGVAGTETASVTNGVWTASFSGVADGTRTITATQTDAAGNAGTSQVSVVVDGTAPAVTITDPAALSNSSSKSIGYTVTETGSGVASATCVLNGITLSPCDNPVNFAGFGSGNYVLTVIVIDAAGNSGSDSTSWTVDDAAPQPGIDEPWSGSATNDTTPPFAGWAGTESGDNASVTVRLYTGLTATGTPTTQPATVVDGRWGINWPTTLSDGDYTVVVAQGDQAGNTGTSYAVTFRVDTDLPMAQFDSGPIEGSSSSSTSASFGFSSTDTDVDYYLCSLDGAGSAPCVGGVTVTNLVDGLHTFSVTAVDFAGNSSPSVTRSWTVVTTPPSVVISSPATGAVVGASLTVTGTASGATGNVTVTVSGEDPASVPVTGGTWTATFGGLAEGPYTVVASMQDSVGNTGTSATVTITVDTTAPTVSISAGPANGSTDNSTSATFGFSSAATDLAGYACDIDGQGFAPCTSTKTVLGLAEG